MTTIDQFDRRNFKAFQNSDDEELQLSWIKGLFDQINFANRPDVLPHFRSQFKDSPEVSGMRAVAAGKKFAESGRLPPFTLTQTSVMRKIFLFP